MTNDTFTRNVLKGALAGAAATWLMTQATTWMYEREAEHAKDRETRARGNRTAYEVAAEKIAGVADTSLDETQRRKYGTAIHWATGIGAAAAYAVLRRRVRYVAAAKGLAFGAAFFLLVDELLNTALGFTPPPQAFPWQAHARGLGGHLAYGMTTELVLEGLDLATGSQAAPSPA